jgi:FKBP-type peptidyl-prolyl cis-trans isomerase FkpA
MSVGTLGAFFLPMITNANQSKESAEMQKLQAEYEKQMSQAAEPLNGYSAEPFDASKVTELRVEDLKTGEGTEATETSTVKVNYFGWTPDGTIFDSSKKSGTVKPIEFSLDQVIPGWTKGLTGAKPGTVRKLTIPADMAYGEAGSPPKIGPNEPLAFIVEVIDVR